MVIATMLFPLFLQALEGQLLDRVVAVVEGDPITQSEMMMELRVILAMREGESVAQRDLPGELAEKFLQDYLITQALVADQTRRYGADEPSDAAVDQAADRLRSRFATQSTYEAFLRKFGIGEARVRDVLRRDLRNDLFLTRQLGVDAKNKDARGKRLETWLSQVRASASIWMLGKSGILEPFMNR